MNIFCFVWGMKVNACLSWPVLFDKNLQRVLVGKNNRAIHREKIVTLLFFTHLTERTKKNKQTNQEKQCEQYMLWVKQPFSYKIKTFLMLILQILQVIYRKKPWFYNNCSEKPKVSFVFRSTKDLQKMPLGKLIFCNVVSE